MLNQALNQPKKWSWLLEDETDNTDDELTLNSMIGVLGMTPQKELYGSTLFKKKQKKKKPIATNKTFMSKRQMDLYSKYMDDDEDEDDT